MIGLFDTLKIGAGALLGGVAALIFSHLVTVPAARIEARATLIAEQAAQSMKEDLERKGDDAKLQRMSDYDLCRAYLGGVPECDTLRVRGVPEE